MVAVRRLTIGVAAASFAALGWMALPTSGQADPPKTDCAGDPASADLANGEGTIAISDRELVVIGRKSQGCMYQRTASKSQLLKHVAVGRGEGTAYVEDRRGADTLVVFTEDGSQRVPAEGEVTQPAWSGDGRLAWAEDFSAVKVWSPSTRSTRTIAAPSTATGVFAPVFAGNRLTAVAQEPVGTQTEMTEDDTLNNLYTYSGGSWRRLTTFDVGVNEWSAIRTPVTTDNGDILFVRVHGDYTATKAPRFELWMTSGEQSRKIRELPGEMFLAGIRDGRLMWNVYSATCGDWELLVEDPRGGLRNLGCGAVLVDPVNITDADLEVEEHAAPEGEAPQAAPVEIGVVVGDFAASAQARKVARSVPGSKVVTHEDAPAAVAPGAFAVVKPLSGSPAETLRSVKGRLPGLRDKVFLAPIDD